MSRFLGNASLLVLITILLGIETGQGSDQSKQEETCSHPIYGPKEVTRRARVTKLTEPHYTEEARAKRVTGTVVLTAVFCRTGKVTNIEVIQGLPYGLTERTVETTRAIKFNPAEKDGEPVSQSFRRECSFHLY